MSLTALLRCNDLDGTREYYRDILGFDVTDTTEGTLSVRCEEACLVFTVQDLWAVRTGCSATFYFHVDDVSQYFERVKGLAEIAWPLQDMPYGTREFGVRDCNGYYLTFVRMSDDSSSFTQQATQVSV
ncbi:VOC family protein [Pseudomonas kurunegalensis]|uniref:VOC family protein n=1 Tax=Pseudomonas kurunegalensis TaxID=485880 RepID=UPI0035560959